MAQFLFNPLSPASTLASPAEPADDLNAQEEGRADMYPLFCERNDALVRFLSARRGPYQDARAVAQKAYVRPLNLDRPGATNFLSALLFKAAANLAVDR